MIDQVKLAEAVARGWCHDANSGKVMDPDLVNAIVKELLASDTLRLLAAYAEAAGAELKEWRDAMGSTIELKGSGNWGYVTKQDERDFQPVRDAEARTDAARAALVAAGIRVGGGE